MVQDGSMRVIGNGVGCVLVHGFSGTQHDLQPLADRLVAEGYSVAMPLLPGHGNHNTELDRFTWPEWLAAVHDAVEDLRPHCTTLILIGFSMGGALCILEALQHGADGLVLLAPALGLNRRWIERLQLPLLGIVKRFRPWFYPFQKADFNDPSVRDRILHRLPAGTSLDDPQVQQTIREQVRLSVASIEQFYRLARRANRVAGVLSLPTLILHGRNDGTIAPRFSVQLFREMRSRDKEIRWWDSAHMLVTGPRGGEVVDAIVQWVKDHIVPTGSPVGAEVVAGRAS
ncbi:MAG: alpha/beta fold hydrolase [Herpetosiphon sp.]